MPHAPPPADLFLRNAGVHTALKPRDTRRFHFAQPFRLRIEAAP